MQNIPLFFRVAIPMVLLVLMYTKPLGLWLRSMNTFFHESAHALTALLVGNKVKEIRLEPTAEGSCKSLSGNRLKTVFVALAGYVSCSLLPLLMLDMIERHHTEIGFLLIAIFAFAVLLLYMRNTYSLVWTTAFAALNLLLYLLPIPTAINTYIYYICLSVIATDNTAACLHILQLSLLNPSKSGDCAILGKTTRIPPLLWAILFNATNILVLIHLFKTIF